MGLGVAELCFPDDSINGVHVPERLYVLSVFEAAATLMKMSNSGAGEIEGNPKRKRTTATKKPRIMKTESPFSLEMPMFMKDRIKKISNYSGDREKNRMRMRRPGPAPATKKQRKKKKTEAPLIPEIPTRIKDGMKKTIAYSEVEEDRERGPAPARKTRSKKKTEAPSVSEMPRAMRNRIAEMGGSNLGLVIEKELGETDLNKNQGRLSLPRRMVRREFLTEEEKDLLGEKEGKKKKGMKVVIMEDDLEERLMSLKKWKIGSEDAYCLMTEWNSFVEERGIRTGDLIQIWSFRRDCFDEEKEANVSMLCLAMVRLPHPHSASLSLSLSLSLCY